MTAFSTVATGTAGLRPPVGTDYSGGLVITGTTAGVIYDAAQLLIAAGSQPADPLAHVTALTIPAAWTIPTDWLGLTAHRWPVGASPAPDIPYSVIRSHDYYINPKSLRWHHLEVSAGVWDWTLFDQWALNCKSLGKDLLYTLGFTPSFYAGSVPAYAVGLEPYGTGTSTAPTDMTKYQAYCQAIVDRLITTLGCDPAKVFLEVWNEPHFVTGYSTYFYSDTAAKLAEMTRITYRIAKAKSASIKVLCAPVSKIETTGRAELVTMLDASAAGITVGGTDGAGTTAADWCDIVAVHTYTDNDTLAFNYGSSMFANMAAVRVIRDARTTTGKPIWITECGYISGALVRPAAFIDRNLRLLLGAVCAGASRVIDYSWDSNTGMGISTSLAARIRLSAMHQAIAGKNLSLSNFAPSGKLAAVFSDATSFAV